MNPNDIPRWLDEHGGPAGPPQTDANGVTTHRAVDGSYVTVFNGQVRMVGHGAPPAAATEAVPAAQTQRQGVGMTQQELEAIINGWGASLGAGDFREEVKQEDVPNPAAYDENGQYIQGTPLTVKGPVTYRTWVKPGTNIRLTVKINADGTYTKVYDGADSSIQPSRAPDAQAPKEEKNPNDPTRMRRWNPQSKQWEDAGPNQEEIDRREKEKADKNKPSVTIREDGKGGLVAISTYPDGRAPTTTPVPGVQGKPDQITHQGVVYERQTDGAYKPAAGIPVPGQARKNIDQFQPDYTQPDLGLGAWAAAQRRKIGLPPDQGGITQSDYDAATKEAHDSASVTITNITNSQNVVRQQAIDNQSRQDTQAGYAENDLGRKQRVYEQIWRYVDPNTDSIRPWLPDSAEAQAMRQRYAGMATPMPSLHPMFTNLATNAGVIKPTGAPTGGTPPPPSSVPPAVTAAAAAPPVRDDYRTNPGQAPAPAAAPAPQPLSPGQSGMMSPVPDAENPPVPQSPGMPGMMSPVMDAENPPVAPATGDPFVGGLVLPQPEPAAPAVEVPPLETPPPWSADPNAAPSGGAFPPLPIVPRAGTEAGGNVQKVMPQPVTGWAMQALGTPPGTVAVQPQQAQAVNPALQAAQQGAQQPLFDPYDTAGRLARMGVPQNAIAQAMREMGMLQEEAVA